MEIHFIDKNSILGWIISQNSGCYPTKDKKVIRKLDRIFIFENIKKLSIAHGQGYYHPLEPALRQIKPYSFWEGSKRLYDFYISSNFIQGWIRYFKLPDFF